MQETNTIGYIRGRLHTGAFATPLCRGLTAGAHACGARRAHYKDIARFRYISPEGQFYRHNVYRNSVQKRTSGSWVARKFVHNMRTAWSHRRHAQDAEGTTGTPALGLEGRAQRRIVIDDEDQGLSVHHPPSSFPRGTVNCMTAPRGTLAVAHSRPPCASIIRRLIASPRPRPCGLVV